MLKISEYQSQINTFKSQIDQISRTNLIKILRRDYIELKKHLGPTVQKDIDQSQHTNIGITLDLLLNIVLLPLEVLEERSPRPTFKRIDETLYVLPDEIELKDHKEYGRNPERNRVARRRHDLTRIRCCCPCTSCCTTTVLFQILLLLLLFNLLLRVVLVNIPGERK